MASHLEVPGKGNLRTAAERTPLIDKSRSVVYTPNKASIARLGEIKSRSMTYHWYPWQATDEQIAEEEALIQTEAKPVASGSSVLLMIFINFLSNVVFSIVVPSLPDYLKNLGGAEYLNGWAVAVNSLGTFLASPVFGVWADKRGTKEVMFASLIIVAGANVWYSLSPNMYMLFAARFVIGIGAANYAPANSYLSYATSQADRSKIMTWYSAAGVLGFICGPAFSLITALKALQYEHKFSNGFIFRFDQDTAPGWISCLLALGGLALLIPFQDIKRTPSLDPKKNVLAQSSMRSVRSLTHLGDVRMRMPLSGVIACLFANFAYTTSFTIFETIGPIYNQANTYLKFDVMKTSGVFAGMAVTGLIGLMALQLLLNLADERILMIGCGFLLTAGVAIFFDWNLGYIPLWRFILGVALVALGYVMVQALLLAVFSKILDESEQGLMMGWMSSSAALARMICPVLTGYAYHWLNNNANYIYLSTAIISALANVGFLAVLPALRSRAGLTAATPTVNH